MKLQTFCRVALGQGQDVWLRDIDRQAPDWLVRALSKHTGVGLRTMLHTSCVGLQGRVVSPLQVEWASVLDFASHDGQY